MKVTFKVAAVTAAVWIVFKLLGYYTGLNTPNYTTLFVLTNMLGVLVAVSIGLYLQKRKNVEDDSALTDIKNGMASGLIYALLVSGFLYFYYEKIDPEYNQKMIAEREYKFQQIVDDPVKLKQLKSSNKDMEVMTKEQIMEEFRKTPNMLFSGSFMMTFGMLAMLMLSTLYSILVTIIFRKVLFR